MISTLMNKLIQRSKAMTNPSTSDTSTESFISNKILNPYKGAFYRYYGAKFRRVKKSYGLLRFYQILIAIDDYLLDRVERALRGEKVIFNLAPDYMASIKWLIYAFENNEWKLDANKIQDIHADILPDIKAIDAFIKGKLSDFFKAHKPDSTENASLSDINEIWKALVKTPRYKEVVSKIGDIIGIVCSTINLPINTEEKLNRLTNVRYTQFSIVPKPGLVEFEASEDVAKQIEFNKKLVQIKETQVKKAFVESGLKVGRLRFGPYMLITGSDPSETEQIVDKATGEVKTQAKIKQIYCDQFAGEKDGSFESMKELQEFAEEYNAKYNALRSLVHNPKITFEAVGLTDDEGNPILDEKGNPVREYQSEGKFLSAKLEYNYIKAKPGIRGQGIKQKEVVLTVNRLSEKTLQDGLASYPEDNPIVTREISDVDRTGKFTRYSLKRNIETQMIKDSIGRDRIIVVSGKYRGFYLDDLVNVEGRMVEGSSYTFNLKGRINKYETMANGDLKLENLEEPYITVSVDRLCKKAKNDADKIANCKLYLGIPLSWGFEAKKFQAERQAMVNLAKKLSDVQMVEGSRRQFWTFSLSSYEAVRTALGSCALSSSASDLVKSYYDDLLKKEYALQPSNVKLYSAERIGGFIDKFKLNNKQMEALAWLDANNFSGLMALDTGVGKTLLATAAIILSKQREAKGEERKFLFVQPQALVGNLKKQAIDIFCLKPQELSTRVDEISYDDFLATWSKGGTTSAGWDKEKAKAAVTAKYGEDSYYAVFFDEINYATTGEKAKAVSGLKHSRKILLTGSAIEKDPTDLFKFVGLTKGFDVTDRKEQNKFVGRYANIVGGRFIGIKPSVKNEFDTWVRTNAYFADKQEVEYEQVGQPALHKPKSFSVGVSLPAGLKRLYLEKAKAITKPLAKMLKVYSQSATERAEYKEDVRNTMKDLVKSDLAKEIRLLHNLSSNPRKALGRLSPAELKAYGIDKNAVVNPKLQSSVSLAKERITKAKVLYFTDDNSLAVSNAKNLSANLPGIHIVCQLKQISLFVNGNEVRVFNKKGGDYLTQEEFNQYDRDFSKKNAAKETDDDETSKLTPEQLEQETKWAQTLFKEFIKPNINRFKTMTCTAAYARGFNFQEFTTVIHLDRNGWSSEEMKQRTARAYRQGQTKQVEEIFVDMVVDGDEVNYQSAAELIMLGQEKELSSVWKDLIYTSEGALLPTIKQYRLDQKNTSILANYLQGLHLQSKSEGKVSIDELKGLIQGKDQEFFSSIIKDAMNLKLLESYEAVQRDTSKSIGTSARLLMRAVNPTAADVALIDHVQKQSESEPLYFDTPFDDKRFDKVKVESIKTSLPAADVLDMSGFGELFNVSSKHTDKPNLTLPTITEPFFGKEIQITQTSANSLLENAKISIKHDGGKAKAINIQSLQFKNCAHPDLFASTILSMIKSAVANGAETISVNASADEVASYVMLGFDADIPVSFVVNLNNKVKGTALEADAANVFSLLTEEANGVKADVFKLGMLRLFKKKTANGITGKTLWKQASVPMKLTLDLKSKTHTEPIMMYFKSKSLQAGIHFSEYFTKKEIAPFNTLNANCWAGFLTGSFDSFVDKPKALIIKKYLKDLKKVIVLEPALAPKLLNWVAMAAPGLETQLKTLVSRLKSTPDLESKVQFLEEKVSKKAKYSKKANAITSFEDDATLNGIWDTLIEIDQAKLMEADIAYELGDFVSAEILKP